MIPLNSLNHIPSVETCDPRPLVYGASIQFNGTDSSIGFWDNTTKYLTALNANDLSLVEVTVTDSYTPALAIDLFNIKLWSSNTYTTAQAEDFVTIPDLAWYSCDEMNGLKLLDRSGNGNNSRTININYNSINEFSFRDNYGYSKYSDVTKESLTWSGQTSAIIVYENGTKITKDTASSGNNFTDCNVWSNQTWSQSFAFCYHWGGLTRLGITSLTDNTYNRTDIDLGIQLGSTSGNLFLFSNNTIISSDIPIGNGTFDVSLNLGCGYYDYNLQRFYMWSSGNTSNVFEYNFSLTEFKIKMSIRDEDGFIDEFQTYTVSDGESIDFLNKLFLYQSAYIPRDESNKNFDVLEEDLQNKGKACALLV